MTGPMCTCRYYGKQLQLCTLVSCMAPTLKPSVEEWLEIKANLKKTLCCLWFINDGEREFKKQRERPAYQTIHMLPTSGDVPVNTLKNTFLLVGMLPLLFFS